MNLRASHLDCYVTNVLQPRRIEWWRKNLLTAVELLIMKDDNRSLKR